MFINCICNFQNTKQKSNFEACSKHKVSDHTQEINHFLQMSYTQAYTHACMQMHTRTTHTDTDTLKHKHTHTHRDFQGFRGGALGGSVFHQRRILQPLFPLKWQLIS